LTGVTRRQQLQADLALLFITFIWGTTFVIVKAGVTQMPPLTFIALRFWLGFAILFLFFWKRLLHINRKMLFAGVAIGVVLFAGYALQTTGLLYTTAAKSGFITGLSVVFVPFLAWRLIGHPPGKNSVIGVILATVGLVALAMPDGLDFDLGVVLSLASCIGFALQIALISKFAPDPAPLVLTTIQVGIVALLATILALPIEGVCTSFPHDSMLAAIFTGSVATALVFAVQNKAQAYTTATRTALIFVLEPVFAAMFAYFWANEQFTWRTLVGGTLIIAGMVVAELRFGKKAKEELEPIEA
jgi:drug/metabolite transporter (DMT)-like permease